MTESDGALPPDVLLLLVPPCSPAAAASALRFASASLSTRTKTSRTWSAAERTCDGGRA